MGTIQIDGSTPKLTMGNATAEDALIVFDGNAQDFYIGLDDSADDLIIGLGSAAGTTPAISINSDRDVTISDGAIDFDVASHDTSIGLKLGGTLVTATAAELNIMDGVTSTAAEINLIDGGTARGTTAIADGDGVLINDAGTMRMTSVETLATYIGGGISNVQSFRLTTSFTGDAAPIASNWETVDTDGYGALGSAVSESSGIFSFGATGVYFIQFQWSGRLNADEKTYRGYIETTLDNSSYSEASEGRIFMQQTSSDNAHNSASVTFIFDVNDTSNRKCRFSVDPVSSSTETLGGTALSYTQATFIRLGDT